MDYKYVLIKISLRASYRSYGYTSSGLCKYLQVENSYGQAADWSCDGGGDLEERSVLSGRIWCQTFLQPSTCEYKHMQEMLSGEIEMRASRWISSAPSLQPLPACLCTSVFILGVFLFAFAFRTLLKPRGSQQAGNLIEQDRFYSLGTVGGRFYQNKISN